MFSLINSLSCFHKYKGSQLTFGGAPSIEVFWNIFGRFAVDVHEYEHDSCDRLSPATHQH